VLADALSRKLDLEVLDISLLQPSHTERKQLIEGYRNDHQLATVYSVLNNQEQLINKSIRTKLKRLQLNDDLLYYLAEPNRLWIPNH
jgi:translation elongation factor EF-4